MLCTFLWVTSLTSLTKLVKTTCELTRGFLTASVLVADHKQQHESHYKVITLDSAVLLHKNVDN